MARMIPPYWHEGTPNSEQSRLQTAAERSWQQRIGVVLHSLNLKQSGTQPYGEVDIVVLIPCAGVFCLEIKGGPCVMQGRRMDDD